MTEDARRSRMPVLLKVRPDRSVSPFFLTSLLNNDARTPLKAATRSPAVAETYTLNAQTRTVTGKKVGQLRRDGLVPAIIYGKSTEPVAIQIPYRALQLTLMKAGGTHLIDIDVDGTAYNVLARDVQRHVIRGDIMHVDFMAVDASTLISAEVPIHFINEAPGVRAGIGILLHAINKLTIEALPADLVSSIEVDLSSLKDVGDTTLVGDIVTGEKIKLMDDPEEMVVRLVPTPAAVSEAEEEAEAAAASEPELVARGKRDEEDED